LVNKQKERDYPAESGDDVSADTKTLMKCSGCDQRSLHLHRQLLRHVTERHELTGPVRDTAEISLIKHVLAVQQREHSQQQRRKEAIQHTVQVQLTAAEVGPQVVEQFREDLGVLLVQDTVRSCEHVVKFTTRAVNQLQTQIYTQRHRTYTQGEPYKCANFTFITTLANAGQYSR